MFAIGDEEWPGISKLTEEAAEVVQVCGKLMGTRGELEHWDGTNLKDRLEEELADLAAAIKFVVDHCGLDKQKLHLRAIEKYQRFLIWHAEERQ